MKTIQLHGPVKFLGSFRNGPEDEIQFIAGYPAEFRKFSQSEF